MATRKTDIHIKKSIFDSELQVWSDLGEWQVKRIEGVFSADTMIGGYMLVIIDKRYDVDDVISEIKALAK